jgi:hypothetical protein
MNRSAKDGARSSPHYWDEGATHSPIAPRCLLAARCGRFMCDPRRPAGVLVLNQVSDPKAKAKWEAMHRQESENVTVPEARDEQLA